MKGLGVSEVITPVRRSLRFLDDYVVNNSQYVDTDPQKAKKTQSTPEKVNQLLKDHGYAYVPNKVLCY